MELRQIRDFLAVVKAGSLARAARTLNISQPGLGYQIKQLELDLDATLFVRHSRGIALTAAGTEFLAEAENIMAAITKAKVRVREASRGAQTEVKIGLSPTPEQLLAPALATLSVNGQPVAVTFREGLSAKLIQDVCDGQLDVAICLAPHSASDLRSIPLYREYLHLIGPPDNSSDDDVPFADLAGYSLVTGPRDHLPRQRLDEEAAARGVTLTIGRELEPGGLRRALVLHGNAYTVASRAMFADEIDNGDLVARRIVEPTIGLEVRMICAAGTLPGLETALLDAIARVVTANPQAAEAHLP